MPMLGPNKCCLAFAAGGCCRTPRTVQEVCQARWCSGAVGWVTENDSRGEVQVMRYERRRLWLTRLVRWVKRRQGNVFIENGIWIIIVVLAMIIPIEALRNALVAAFGQIVNNLNAIP